MNYPQHPALRKYTQTLSLYMGCLFAGAAGDALGAAVEFISRDQILSKFGVNGIQQYAPCYGGLGKITDDTQMTLFTAEGLLMAWYKQNRLGLGDYPSQLKNAYLRWLATQNNSSMQKDGFLHAYKDMYSRRAPGNTCLTGLQQIARQNTFVASNNSKGCGTIMRVAPVAIMAHASLNHDLQSSDIAKSFDWVYEQSIVSAALTHGHPTGQIAAAAFALILFAVLCGQSMPKACDLALLHIQQKEFHEETSQALSQAIALSQNSIEPHLAIAQLGEGWIAEEALAIAVFCALKANNIAQGIEMAVNITGDSDSTGSMAGQLLGALYGYEAIPEYFLDGLEMTHLVDQITQDLLFVYMYCHGIFTPEKRHEILLDFDKRYS